MGDESIETTVRVVTVEHAGQVRCFRLVEVCEAEEMLLAVLVQEPQV